jgi:hypothetical protein
VDSASPQNADSPNYGSGFPGYTGTVGAVTSTKATTTTAAKSTSSTTTQVAVPTPSNHVSIVLYEVIFSAGGYIDSWVVFAAVGSSPIDVCDTVALADVDGGNVQGGSDQGYPDATISFSALGIDGCEYKGSSDAPGTMTCPGVDNIVCERDSLFGQDLSCGSDGGGDTTDYYLDVICSW